MKLFYGISLACVSVILFSVTLLGSRNPKNPKWAGDFLVSNIYIPAIMGLFVVSIFLISTAFSSSAFDTRELLLSGISVTISVLFIWRLKIRKKIKEYAAQEDAAGLGPESTMEIVLPPKPEPENPDLSPPRRLAA